MTKKVYRTAQGKLVDLGALQLQNEDVRAVGNMSVNARGDLIDGWNHPIEARNKQVGRQYDRQTSNVKDEQVTTRPVPKSSQPRTKNVEIPKPPEDFNDDFDKSSTDTTAPVTGGLAAAIAKARKIQQEPITKPDTKGIRRI